MNPKDLVGAKKAPMDLVPPAGAIMSAPAHQNGADKYGPFNWRLNPVQLMTYLGAIRRHMDAFIDGQDEAEDTGIHHLSHMLAGMNIIADAMSLGNLIDNRPPKGPAADMLRAQDKSLAPKLEMNEAVGRAMQDPESTLFVSVKPIKFLCGHSFGEEPITAENSYADGPVCGSSIHWSRVNGIFRQPNEDDKDLIAICEDSGNHVGGRHLLSCPEYS